MIRRIAAGLVLCAWMTSSAAEAGWTRPNKKPVTAWQGFKNSANGAVTNLMPWNWFGKKED